MPDIVERLRAAARDERLSTGALYQEAAEEIEFVRAAYLSLLQQWRERASGNPSLTDKAAAMALLERWLREDQAGDG